MAKAGKNAKTLRSLHIRVAADGKLRVATRSRLFNLSDPGNASLGHNFDGTGAVVLAPPFNVRGDGGNALSACAGRDARRLKAVRPRRPRRKRLGHLLRRRVPSPEHVGIEGDDLVRSPPTRGGRSRSTLRG
jgi:hypothetical protein